MSPATCREPETRWATPRVPSTSPVPVSDGVASPKSHRRREPRNKKWAVDALHSPFLSRIISMRSCHQFDSGIGGWKAILVQLFGYRCVIGCHVLQTGQEG